jgi:hypothetical protein
MNFRKQDLAGQQYHWNDSIGETMYTGQPSRRAFDRYNGDQVLFLINFYCSTAGRQTVPDCRLIESKIADQLPLDARSEITVFNWLRSMDFSEVH